MKALCVPEPCLEVSLIQAYLMPSSFRYLIANSRYPIPHHRPISVLTLPLPSLVRVNLLVIFHSFSPRAEHVPV